MIKNYFKIAFRSLWRNKAFSAINLFGLVLGIASCLIIMLFVINELSYDRYNKKASQIVRVVFRGSVQGEKMKEASVMPPTAQTLLADYPEVQQATRIRDYGSPRITYGDKTFSEDRFAFADANLFQVFTLPFEEGDPLTALQQPNTVVITNTLAHKYFGNEDAIGKTINIKSQGNSYKVTGVIKDIPSNSHFHFGLFAAMAGLPEAKEPTWMSSNFHTYLVLAQGYDYKKLQAKLPQVIEKYIGPQLQKAFGMSLAQFRSNGNDIGLFLQPLTDIHLHSDLISEFEASGDIQVVYIFGAIAIFMLLIACINFMNLSTAGASKRAREVGIRKVLGSVKLQLVKQFMFESLLLTAIAMVVALALVQLALPLFNSLADKNLSLNFSGNTWLIPSLILFGLLVGVLAGSYPAFYLSSFRPIAVLKGRFTSGKKSSSFRSGLVVFQFFISISLIVGTAVVYKQLLYIHNKELGYSKDHVIILPDSGWLGNSTTVFKSKLLQDTRIANVSISGYLPAGPTNNNNFIVYPDNNSTQYIKTLKYDVDEQYVPVMGMQIVAGRNFSPDYETDSTGIIINETTARELGWGKNALGHTLSRNENDGKRSTYRVIGIVKDFHFKSLHELISPLVMTLSKYSGSIIVKAKTKDIGGLLDFMKKEWAALSPEEPFQYSFMDNRLNDTYKNEQKTGTVLGIFAGLTIFVACLGLFGLAMYTAEQRRKEIGIRKVLGASVQNVATLLSKEFLKLVMIALAIALPGAGWIMNKWLQDFAYRINIPWWLFVSAGILTIIIAMFTISFQAIKAAMANPVKSLRAE